MGTTTTTGTAEPADNAIRFDAALAAARFGRGNDLIGLHLTLGILREALVCRMVAADQAEGHTHHRFATGQDDFAMGATSPLRAPLSPATARAAYAQYGLSREEIEPGYVAALEGLDAVISLGPRT